MKQQEVKMIKAVFFDVDGTLVSESKNIVPDSSVDALTRAMERGHLVFVNSGRPRCELRFLEETVPAGEEAVCLFPDEVEGESMRLLMNRVLEKDRKLCAVFYGNDVEGYRYVIGSRKEDVRPFGKELNERFAGRGGGKPEMVQGSLKGKQCLIEEYLKNK